MNPFLIFYRLGSTTLDDVGFLVVHKLHKMKNVFIKGHNAIEIVLGVITNIHIYRHYIKLSVKRIDKNCDTLFTLAYLRRASQVIRCYLYNKIENINM